VRSLFRTYRQDRYPVSLRVRYKATSNREPVQGFGQTRMMSSDIVIEQTKQHC
jgi:hypothetical protein